MAKVSEEVVQNYIELVERLPEIIRQYRLDKDFLAEQSGIKRSSLYRKLKNGSFTKEEMLDLVRAINL